MMELKPGLVAQLVDNVRQGNVEQFEQIVLIYQDKLYSLARRLTGSAHDAEDLAQEVFVRAYRSIASFRGESDFGTWLHRIAVNTWLNQKRKKAPVTAYSLDEPVVVGDESITREVASPDKGPEDALVDEVFGERLQKAIDSLPKEQKAVILLREVEERTYEEIAVIMSCSVGTVRSRLSRARDTLRLRLNGVYSEQSSYFDSDTERRAEIETQNNKKAKITING